MRVSKLVLFVSIASTPQITLFKSPILAKSLNKEEDSNEKFFNHFSNPEN